MSKKTEAKTARKSSPENNSHRHADAEPDALARDAEGEDSEGEPASLVPPVSLRPTALYLAAVAEEAADVPAGTRTGLDKTIGMVALNKANMLVLLTKQTNKRENGLWQVRAGEWAQAVPSSTTGGIAVYAVKNTAYFVPAEGDFGGGIESNWTKQ